MPADGEYKCLQVGAAVSTSKQVLDLRSHSCRSSGPDPGLQEVHLELLESSVTGVQWLVCCLGDAGCFSNVLTELRGKVQPGGANLQE